MNNFNDYKMLDIKKDLANIFRSKAERFAVSFEQHDYTDNEIRQSCDDEVGQFMRDKWGDDWEKNEQAERFYELVACDMRIAFEYEMIGLYQDMNS